MMTPMTDAALLVPGSWLGMIGGGQLGRMFAIAARRMGYRVQSPVVDEAGTLVVAIAADGRAAGGHARDRARPGSSEEESAEREAEPEEGDGAAGGTPPWNRGGLMPASVIVGLQWGDEGKGKTTDFLAEQTAMVVRYQGGDNAGHTVVRGDEVFKLLLTPSGVLYPHMTSVIGNGVVVNPVTLIDEFDMLTERGIGYRLVSATLASTRPCRASASWNRSVDRKLPSSSSSAYLAVGRRLRRARSAGPGSKVALWMIS